jgi:hypothetical protein
VDHGALTLSRKSLQFWKETVAGPPACGSGVLLPLLRSQNSSSVTLSASSSLSSPFLLSASLANAGQGGCWPKSCVLNVEMDRKQSILSDDCSQRFIPPIFMNRFLSFFNVPSLNRHHHFFSLVSFCKLLPALSMGRSSPGSRLPDVEVERN